MDTSALFKGLQNLFGESRYEEETEDLEPFHIRLLRYRAKEHICVDWSCEKYPSDEGIIKSHLSKLTYDELNAVDDNGASILHLAVHYNRAGQNGYCNLYDETNKNIVKWLLNNPAFNQKDAKGKFCFEKYSYKAKNAPRGNAFHLAFAARVPEDIQFCSENFGGQFGSTFVAGGALDAMLNHENFARAYINSCNDKGQSVLEYALQMFMERLRRMEYIRFHDNLSFNEHIDCSIGDYADDYPSNIRKLLECKYLRAHSTFGVVMISNQEGNYLMPEQLVYRERTFKIPAKGLEVFRQICTWTYRMSGGMRANIVNAMLSGNVGQVPDCVKAQSMSICISCSFESRGEWLFNPSKLRDKKVGAIMRKFFVKHAGSALYAIQRYTSIIHREYDECLLCDVRDALCERHSLSSKLWMNILAYAGYRNEISFRLDRLSGLNDTIQNSILPFFYGGIQSCVDRKLEALFPADVWGLIFQFAGLRPSFAKNLDEILGPMQEEEEEEEEEEESNSESYHSESESDDDVCEQGEEDDEEEQDDDSDAFEEQEDGDNEVAMKRRKLLNADEE